MKAPSSGGRKEKKRQAEIEAIRKADSDWLKAVQDRNIEKLATCYHDDATWLLLKEPAITSKEAILKMWSKTYESPGFHIEWKPFRVEVSDSLDMGVSVGYWNISNKTSKGSSTEIKGSYVVVWRKGVRGDWRVLIDISN